MHWVEVGKVTRPHGLKGELKLLPFVTDLTILKSLKQGRLDGGTGPETPVEVESVRGSANNLIIKFQQVESREQAGLLAGQILQVPADQFQPLPEGEFYWFEILGLNVYDEAENHYGSVEEIIETGSNDVYVVRGGGREVLLPMIDSVVKTIDLKQNKLIFHRVEGLIEDDPV